MQDGTGLISPEFKPLYFAPESTALRLPGYGGFQDSPELYDNIRIAHQSGFKNWLNTFVQGVQQTKVGINQSDLMSGLVSKAELENKLENLESDYKLRTIDDVTYLSEKNEILGGLQKAYSDVNEANQKIAGHERSIYNHPVPKGYQFQTQLNLMKGTGQSSLHDYFKYAAPNVMGSSAATLTATLASGFLGQLVKKGITTAAASSVGGPWGTLIGFIGGAATVLGTNAIARNLETKAEVGAQFSEDLEELKEKYLTNKPQGYQLSSKEENDLILQAAKGTSTHYWKNMSLAIVDTVQAMLFAGGFTKMLQGLSSTSKLARLGTGLGELYIQKKSEGIEEGLQQAWQYEKHGKALGLEDYMSQGHSLYQNWKDVIGSMKWFGIRGEGPYSEDQGFIAAVEAGEFLGTIFGGVGTSIQLARDVKGYQGAARELRAANPTKTDQPILRLKDEIYAQFFSPKKSGPLNILGESADDRVFYFKEALKSFNKKLNREGKPLLSDEELSEELKDIDRAYQTFSKVNNNLDTILSPANKASRALSTLQKSKFRNELFHNTLSLQRLTPKLVSKEAEMLQSITSESFPVEVSELATIQAKLDVINKRLETSFGNYADYLNREKRALQKQFKEISKTYKELEGKEATLPTVSQDSFKAINDFYDVAETKYDLTEKREKLAKVKSWKALKSWFSSYVKNATEGDLASQEKAIIEDNKTYAEKAKETRTVEFSTLNEEDKKARENQNKEILELGGYGKTYIDTLTPEQQDLEASKVLEDFLSESPRITEDQLLHMIGTVETKEQLISLLTRPSVRAAFNAAGFDESQNLEDIQAKAEAKILALLEERSKNKKRKLGPQVNPFKGSVGRIKSQLDNREVADLQKEWSIQEGKASQRAVLQAIIDSKFATEPEKELAKKLLEITTDEEIEFVDLSKDGVRTASGRTLYKIGGGTRVLVDLTTLGDDYEGNKLGQAPEVVILHELVHRYTLTALDGDSEFKKQVEALLSEAKNNSDKVNYYGLTNAQEFVTEVMTSPHFQKFLASIPSPNKKESIWESFINAVAAAFKRMFGIDIKGSLLEDAINLTSEIIEGNKKISVVQYVENTKAKIDLEFSKLNLDSKDIKDQINTLFERLYTEITIVGEESDLLNETLVELREYLSNKTTALEAEVDSRKEESKKIIFGGKVYEKGSYVIVRGYGEPYYISGEKDGKLSVGTTNGASTRHMEVADPDTIIFVGNKAEAEYFIESTSNPEPKPEFTPSALFKSTGAQVKIVDGKVEEQTEPIEKRFYNFLKTLSKLDLTKSPYYGLIIQDEDSYKGFPIPHTKSTQDFFAQGGKRGQVVIIIDSSGTPVRFDENGIPSETGEIVVFNIETPDKILKRDTKKLADALQVSMTKANELKIEAARKVREARASAAKGKPIMLRLRSISPGVSFKDVIDEVETRPLNETEASQILSIVKYLQSNKDQTLKDFLFNYAVGRNGWRVSGGKLLLNNEEVMTPTVGEIVENFSLKKSYDLTERNDPYTIFEVINGKPSVVKTFPSYQEYLKSISNLKTDITSDKYNQYLVYEIGEVLDKEELKQAPDKQSFEEGGLFDAPITREFDSPISTNDLALFNNLTTYTLVKTIDKGVHSYLKLTDLKTIGEATEDPTFITSVLNITQKNILIQLSKLRELREQQHTEGKISTPVYEVEVTKILDKIDKISKKWKEISDYYLKNSYVFSYSKSIKFGYDENGNLIREGDDTNTATLKGFDRTGNEVSPIDGASKEIKALVRGLSRYKEVEGKWVRVLNEFNVPDLNSFPVTWNNLLKNLNGIEDFSEMLMKLDSLVDTFPEYQELLDIMRKYYAKAQTGDVEARRMIALFKRDLGKPEIPIIENIVEPVFKKDKKGKDSNELEYTVFKSDEATRKNVKELKKLFQDNFTKRSPYRVATTTGNIALSKGILNQPVKTKADRVKFFESLGFKFSPSTLTDPIFDELTSAQVIGLFKSDIKTLQENKVIIKEPLTDLARRTKSTQGLSRRINDLIELESKYSRVAPSLSMQNVEENTEWAISNPNTYTIVTNAINNASKYPTYQDLINEPHLAFLGMPYARTSHALNQIFILDSDVNYGQRRPGKPVKLEVINISGLKIESGNGKKTTSLYIGDKIVSDFNQLPKNGYKEITRAGDKNSSFGIKLSGYYQGGKLLRLPIADFKLFEGAEGYGGDQMISILTKYLMGEIVRIYLGQNNYLSDVNKLERAAYEFSLFRDILNEPTQEIIKSRIRQFGNLEPNSKELYDQAGALAAEIMSSASATSQVKRFFYTEVVKKQQSLNKHGFSFQNPFWLDSSLKDIPKGTLLRAYIVNEFIIHVEQTKLFNGDVVFYSNKTGEFHKRTPKDGATGVIPITDRWWTDAANVDPNNNLQSKLLGVNNPYSNVIKTVVFRELVSKSTYLNEWRTYLKNSGVSDQAIKRIVDPYEQNKEADAQGWVTMDFYRNFKLSIGAWTREQENVYEKVAKAEALNVEEVESLHRLFPPVKAQYAGPVKHLYYHVPGFHKFSLMPLIPSAIKGTALEHLNERMLRQNVSYALMESGSKVGTISKGGMEPFYRNETRAMEDPTTSFKNENLIFMHFLKEQVQVEPELHDEVIYGTQFRKLLFQNIYSEGKSLNLKLSKLEQEYSDIIEEITEFEKIKLTKELGVEPQFKNGELIGYTVKDESKLIKKLQDEIEKRKLNDNIKEFFQLKDGKLKYTIDASQNHQQIRNMIMSMINNRLIRQTIKGDMLIEGSSTGYEKYVKPTEVDLLKYGTNGLRFYYVKDGKVINMQVKVPLTGDFKHLLKFEWNGESIETLERLNQAIKDENWLNKNRRAITMIGYRIPTQGLNSIESMEIVEFLPPEAGNILIVPTEIVIKAGSDFDIDKLNVFKPSIKYNADLKEAYYVPKPKQKLSYSKAEKIAEGVEVFEKQRELELLIFHTSEKLKDNFNEEDSRTLVALKADLADLEQEYKQLFDEFEAVQDYRQGLFNRIIELGVERLADPNSFVELITPNSTDLIKPIVETELGVKPKSYKHTANLLSSTQEEKYLAGIPNKKALGIAAVANTFSQLLNKAGLKLTGLFGLRALNHPMLPKGKYSISNKDLITGVPKSEIESQMINAYVDVLNDDFISKANLSLDTAGAFFYLLHLGHDHEQLILFFNNPIIKAFVGETQKNKSLLIRALDSNFDIKSAKKNAFIRVVDITEKHGLKSLRAQAEKLIKPEHFTKEHLKEAVSKPLDSFSKEEKMAVLGYYLNVLEESQELLNLQQINNYDTSTSVNPIAHEYREFIKNKLIEKQMFEGDVESITKKTVIKPFNQYQLISSVLDIMLPVSLNSGVRKAIVAILEELSENFELEIDPEKLARTFINDWLYYIYMNLGELKDGRKIGGYGKSLLFGPNPLTDKLLELKTDEKWSRLRDNFPIIEQFRVDIDDTINNISLYRDDNSVEYQNTLIEQFLTLGNLEDPTFTPEEQTEVKKFFRNLAILGFTQSGLNKSPISFTDVIPNDFYVPLMDEALKKYQTLPYQEQHDLFADFTQRFSHQNPHLFGERAEGIKYWRYKEYTSSLGKPPAPLLKPIKIISGGQTGGDLGGLEGGKEVGIETGGTAPPGWISGGRSAKDLLAGFGLQEGVPDPATYPKRTMKNVDDSDGTVAILWGPSVGTDKTIGYAQTHKWQKGNNQSSDSGYKPVLVIKTKDVGDAARQLRDFVSRNNIKILNVAGHREQSQPGIQAFTKAVIVAAFKEQSFESPLSSQENIVSYNVPLQEGSYQALLKTLLEAGLIIPKCE